MYGYLAAALALAAAVAYGLWERGNAADALHKRDIAVVERQAAEADRDRAVGANEKLQQTVSDLQEAATKSNRIIAKMVSEQDETQKAVEQLRRDITETTDAPTKDYLGLPVPDYLGVQLNR